MDKIAAGWIGNSFAAILFDTTGFGGNSNQGQIVTNIGYYLGLLVTNSNDSLIILPRPN